MTLLPGARLGPYEVVALLGVGGMGEVYRARDTKLDRDVAIKVLPEAIALDADRLARFEREAKTLASLNHPNIAHVYGLDRQDATAYIVMELVEGEELAQRIARGPMPIDEALPVAKQIAEALEAAHDQGIIHRDLKPANIKVRPDGTVKVLDFGLAKAMDPAGASSAKAMNSPTLSMHATMAGIILGTAAYMSPEHARGKTVDKRADIWAFGCVLYEMLAGRRAFAGDDGSDVIASVLAREPDLTALPDVPPPIRRLLRRCFQKDRHARLRDIGDARIEIADVLSGVDAPVTAVPDLRSGRRTSERIAWGGAALALAFALATSWIAARGTSSVAHEMRLEIVTPPTISPMSLALSPDGRTMAFVATSEGQSWLWLRSLESGSSHTLPGTDGAALPFWSPDGRSIGFFAEDKLRRIDVEGGSVQTLANASGASGGTWSRDGVILFASLGTPIRRVPASGGEPVALRRLAQQGSVFSPRFLPDGRHFLYYVRGNPEIRGVYVGVLDDTLEARRLLESDGGAVYAPTGQLLFVRAGTVFGQNFDLVRLQLAGNPFPVAERVGGRADLIVSVSDAGSLAYRTSSAGPASQLVWFDRSGKEIGRVGESLSTGGLSAPSLSPDGERVVLYRAVNGNADIWVVDTKRGVLSRLTTDPADEVFPVWSPDGGSVLFSSNRKGIQNLYRKSMTAGGSEELLLSTAENKTATDWSSDGRFVVYNVQDPTRGADIWAWSLNGQGKPFPVVQTAFAEQGGQFSADGHWITYQSNESGRAEIYVQPFPGPGNKWIVSTNGGTQARWRRDGQELFYVARDGRVMAVPIRLPSNIQAPAVGTPVPLFAPALGGAVAQGDARHQYMVSSDGQRILVATVADAVTSPITIVLNWKPRP